jgi:hypothetical protein
VYERRAIDVMLIEHMIMSTDYIPKFDQDHFFDQSIREPDEMYRRIFDLGSLIRYVPGDCSELRDADTLISGKRVALTPQINNRLANSNLTTDTWRHDLLRKLKGELVSPVAILGLTAQGEHEAALLIDRILSASRNIGDCRQSSRKVARVLRSAPQVRCPATLLAMIAAGRSGAP